MTHRLAHYKIHEKLLVLFNEKIPAVLIYLNIYSPKQVVMLISD